MVLEDMQCIGLGHTVYWLVCVCARDVTVVLILSGVAWVGDGSTER